MAIPPPAPRTRTPLPTTTKTSPPHAPPPPPPPLPQAPLSKAAIYKKLRPFVLAAAVVGIVVSCTLGGAILKESWQRRQARKLFAEQEEDKRKSAGGPTLAEEDASVSAKDSSSSIPSAVQREQLQQQSSTRKPGDQKKILGQIHDLELRRKELLRSRGVLVDKVEKLQERMRKREEDERLKQERAKEGERIGVRSV